MRGEKSKIQKGEKGNGVTLENERRREGWGGEGKSSETQTHRE